MKALVLENGPVYQMTVYGHGISISIVQLATGKEVHLQGDDAVLLYDQYNEMTIDHETVGTRASRFTWPQLVDEMVGCYFY